MSTMTTTMTPPTGKAIWQSKTFWLNAISIVLAILAITEPTLIPIDPKMLLWITAVLNIVLRFLTNQPVSVTGSKSSAA